MWKNSYIFVFLLCFKSYLGHPQYDMGQQISQQVRDSLKGLDHLGRDIEANVQQQLEASGVYNLGARISADLDHQLAPLENLGAEIEAKVQKSLLPVYAMAIRRDMAEGIGGTTVVTYNIGNTPRSFIMKNRQRNICKGTITGSECDGTLEPFTIKDKEDYCYTNSYAIINNNVCLSTGSINVMVNNNHITCTSNDDLPVIYLTKSEFQNLCGNITPQQIIFKYFANSNDSRAIPIPNSNPYVNCRNADTPGVCEFEADHSFFSSNSVTNGNVSIRNGNIVSYAGGGIMYDNN